MTGTDLRRSRTLCHAAAVVRYARTLRAEDLKDRPRSKRTGAHAPGGLSISR